MGFIRMITREMDSIIARDPAARSRLEVFLCYPGFHAVIWHRIAHYFYRHKLFLLARIVSQLSRWLTMIEIHPGATIGKNFFIDHGAGVVIGETAEVGDCVTIYQGVTLGGTGKEKGKRHPTIGNNVTISTGARVLGSIVIGDHVKIGAGSVVLKSVPPNCTVVGVPGRIVVNNGARVEDMTGTVDLEHHMLPDPIADTLQAMQEKIAQLEQQLEELRRESRNDQGLQYAKQAKGRV
jgi:serine O-acetyltransferase